jgi:hypothetical protein
MTAKHGQKPISQDSAILEDAVHLAREERILSLERALNAMVRERDTFRKRGDNALARVRDLKKRLDAVTVWRDMEDAPQNDTIVLLARPDWAVPGCEHPIIGRYFGENDPNRPAGFYTLAYQGQRSLRLACIGWLPRPEFVMARMERHAAGGATPIPNEEAA